MDIKVLLEKVWPEWKVVRLIGQGNFGSVYEIGHSQQGRAALRVLELPRYTEGLRDEISAMAEQQSAPTIVKIDETYCAKKDDGPGAIVLIRMELLQNLPAYIKAKGPLLQSEIDNLGKDIAAALVHCKANGIIHGNLKPENIFRTDSGEYKLGDVGISGLMSEQKQDHGEDDTDEYLAPELLRGRPYNETVDIYALGVVLYRYLNKGRTPFMPSFPEDIKPADVSLAKEKRLCGETPTAPEKADKALASIIIKACASEPANRYQSAEDMLKDLNSYAAGNLSVLSTKKEMEELKPFVRQRSQAEKTDTEFEQDEADDTNNSGRKSVLRWLIPAGVIVAAGIGTFIYLNAGSKQPETAGGEGYGTEAEAAIETEIIAETEAETLRLTELLTEYTTEPVTEKAAEN